jgi:hypothetical protein
MRSFRSVLAVLIVGGLASTAGVHDASAQRERTCAEVLTANANYAHFIQGLDRVRAFGILSRNEPMTILAFDNNAIERIPPRIRNSFIPPGPEDGASPIANRVVDHLYLEGIHHSAEFKPGFTLYTINDATVMVVGLRDGKPVLRAGGYDVLVVAPDQECHNGVIHGISFIPRGE